MKMLLVSVVQAFRSRCLEKATPHQHVVAGKSRMSSNLNRPFSRKSKQSFNFMTRHGKGSRPSICLVQGCIMAPILAVWNVDSLSSGRLLVPQLVKSMLPRPKGLEVKVPGVGPPHETSNKFFNAPAKANVDDMTT